MKLLLKAAMAATVLTSAPVMMATPAAAQSRLGVAIANLPLAIAATNAYRTARDQMRVTYKAQLDAFEARAKALQPEMEKAANAYKAAASAPNATEKTVAPAAQAYQAKQAAAEQELSKLSAPTELALAYVEDQIQVKMDEAIRKAMEKQKVDLLISPEAVLARSGTVDITKAIVDELNVTVPSVQIVPPANYKPGQLTAEANKARMEAAKAAAQPAGAKPASR